MTENTSSPIDELAFVTNPEESQLGIGMLNVILKNTVHTIEESKSQIFEVYESAKKSVERARRELSTIRQEAAETIAVVDALEKDEQKEKQCLVRVSANFKDYSEERIKETYDAVKDVQIRLGIAREKEGRLRRLRDECEIRLYHMQKTVVGAEQLAMRISSVLNYLSSQVSDAVAQMEKVSQNRFLSAAIIKAQEDERYRVAREIHDGPAQDVANLLFQASICERLITVNPDEARANLQELRRQLKGCLTDIRQVIFDMRPMALDDLGLVAAVRQLVNRLDERSLLRVEFSAEGEEPPLPNHVNTGIFRIIQEALNNVSRHSGQKAAQVRMLFNDSSVSVLIEDQGKGFDFNMLNKAMQESPEENGNFGLIGMQERAKIIGATLSVTSNIGKGTRIHLRLPLRVEQPVSFALSKEDDESAATAEKERIRQEVEKRIAARRAAEKKSDAT